MTSRVRHAVAAPLVAVAVLLLGGAREPARRPGNGTVTLIHIGDIHGHLLPRPDAVSGRAGTVGGVARIATVAARIRHDARDRALLVNVGDAVQGGAEALFTRGQAVVDVLALLRIDAYVPGNWDYVYGIDRFIGTFVGAGDERPLAPWPSIAANLYYATPDAGNRSPYVDVTGERVLPPFLIRDVGDVRVGIIGLTTTRGPRALGAESTRGLMFTPGAAELPAMVRRLREHERVDVVVLASELELAKNLRLAERIPGIDVILSADMHELTREPIVASTGTVIVEEGQDGAAVGELALAVKRGVVASWRWQLHEIDDSIAEDPVVARVVSRVRAPFVRGPSFDPMRVNPIDGARLSAPIDEVVGRTTVALHRANPSSADVPAVLEGSSHDFLADAFRSATGADIALVRGFRFGTQVRPGPVTREDLYHYLPIGAQVARVDDVPAAVVWRQLEASLDGVVSADLGRWTGGWLVGVSGLRIELDAYAPVGSRVRRVLAGSAPLDTTGARRYSVAGLWFASEPTAVSNCAPCVADGAGLTLVRSPDQSPMDAVEVVAAYLASLPDSTASPGVARVRLVRPLPASPFPFPELQPLRGVPTRAAGASGAGQTAVPARH